MRVSAFNPPAAALLAITIVACSKDAARQSANKRSAAIDTAAAGMQTAVPRTTRASSPVGLAYDQLPSGVTFVSGAVIPSNPGAQSFDVAHVKTPDGDRLWLETAGPNVGGAPTHLVVADLALPPIGQSESLAMASCDVNAKLDPRVVAVVSREPNATRLTKVRQAWRANLDAKRFDVIPVDGITCEEPDSRG